MDTSTAVESVVYNRLSKQVLFLLHTKEGWSRAHKKRVAAHLYERNSQYKGIEIHEAEACKDHIHMLVSIPPKYSVSQIMGYLKGKSSLMIYEKYANLKYKYGNRHFWCRGYYVSTVGRNRRAIEEYIKNQLQEDYTDDQLSIKEFVDPFTDEPVRGGK